MSSPILPRVWKTLTTSNDANKIKLMSWNMLAQCLVRRDLFPTSDCLKAKQREDMTFNEILAYKANILCLQEVDRLDKLVPLLESASYGHIYANGPGKLHGCMIAYSSDIFEEFGHSVALYDDLSVLEGARSEADRKGLTRLTKNVGLIVGLKRRGSSTGFIIATTHLFWHPRFTYERVRQVTSLVQTLSDAQYRTRQSLLLLREIKHFRQQQDLSDWPCIIAGDFNFPPTDPAYSLLIGGTLTQDQWKKLDESRVIHVSIDSSLTESNTSVRIAEDENADPDVAITNSRSAGADDALLSNEGLLLSFQRLFPVRSAYEEGQRSLRDSSSSNTFGSRFGDTFPLQRIGHYEPMWTSYTHYWKSTLDYIFILNEPGVPNLKIQGFLETPPTSLLEPGLPMKHKCGSDHISLVVEIVAQD